VTIDEYAELSALIAEVNSISPQAKVLFGHKQRFNKETTRIPFGERRRTRAGWSDPALILLQSLS
jgi:hypothetical protein